MSTTIEVLAHAINVREGPGVSFSASHGLGQGQHGVVENFAYDQWLHLTAPWSGYLYAGSQTKPNVQAVNIVVAPSGVFQVKTSTDLNVRSTPVVPPASRRFDKSFNYLFTLKENTVVSVDKEVNGWYKLAGVEQYINATYAVRVTSPAPQPVPPKPTPNPPNLPWSLPFAPSQRGVHGNAGGWSPSDTELSLIHRNQIETILLVAYNAGVAGKAIPRLRGAGISHFIIRAETTEKPTNAQRFLNITMPILREYADALGSTQDMMIAIHNEPNVYDEGYGSAWHNGGEFASWWATVAGVYRGQFPGCKLGFPALSPGGNDPFVRADSTVFAQQAVAAIRAADWVGVHEYWQENSGTDFAPSINAWRQLYAGKPLVGTEIGPVGDGIVTPFAVRNAYSRMADAGISSMIWILNGSGTYKGADWTVHDLNLANPNPPPTPPPQPTPQPGSGVISKLGIHIETTGGVSADLLNTATRLYHAGKPWALVVVIDDVGLANAMVQVCRHVIYRAWAAGNTFKISNLTSEAAAKAEADKVWANHAPFVAQLDKRVWIQTRNEMGSTPFDYAYECQIMDLAKAQGRHAVIYGDGPGQPELNEFQWRIPALRQAMRDDHALSLHEYSAFINKQPSDTPLCDLATRPSYGLRHRMLYASVPADCRPKLFNSETGLSTVHMDSIEDIESYCDLLNEDSYVEGMAIYGYGASVYNLNGQLAALEQLRMRQN